MTRAGRPREADRCSAARSAGSADGASEPNRMIPPTPLATRGFAASTSFSLTGTTTSWAARRSRLQVASRPATVHPAVRAGEGDGDRGGEVVAAGAARVAEAWFPSWVLT